MSLFRVTTKPSEALLQLVAEEPGSVDAVLAAVHDALSRAFAPLTVEIAALGGWSTYLARFDVSGPGWSHHHAIYLTRNGGLRFAIEHEVPLEDPSCFEKVASEMKANLDAM